MSQPQIYSSILRETEALISPKLDRDLLERLVYTVGVVSDIGSQILELRNTGRLTQDTKGDGSKVTNADLLARDFFQNQLPRIENCEIVSEESKNEITTTTSRGLYWIVDELDGTSSYLRGYSNFGPLVALQRASELELGVAGLPAMQQVFFAAKGLGAFCLHENSGQVEAIRTRNPKVGCLEFSGFFGTSKSEISHVGKFLKVESQQIAFQPVGALLKYCQVAQGAADAAGGSMAMKVWDIAAAILIVREAGGEVFDMDTMKPVVINLSRTSPYRVIAVGQKETFVNA